MAPPHINDVNKLHLTDCYFLQNSSFFYPDYSAQFLDSMNDSRKSDWTQQTDCRHGCLCFGLCGPHQCNRQSRLDCVTISFMDKAQSSDTDIFSKCASVWLLLFNKLAARSRAKHEIRNLELLNFIFSGRPSNPTAPKGLSVSYYRIQFHWWLFGQKNGK